MGEVIFASRDLSYRYEGADFDAVSAITSRVPPSRNAAGSNVWCVCPHTIRTA